MDLTVIALIQALFLGGGLYTLFASRPVYLVATEQIFNLVFAADILPADLKKAKNEYQQFGVTQPKLVGAVMPKDAKEVSRIVLSALGGGSDLQHMPQYYVEYSQMKEQILKNALPLINPPKVSSENIAILKKAAISYGYKPEDARFMHVASSRGFAVVLIDAKTAEPIGFVNLDI